jgi:hypothetical protein
MPKPVKDNTRVIPYIAKIKPPVKEKYVLKKVCDIHLCVVYQHEINKLGKHWRTTPYHHDPSNENNHNYIRDKIIDYNNKLLLNGFGAGCCVFCPYRKESYPIGIPPKINENEKQKLLFD